MKRMMTHRLIAMGILILAAMLGIFYKSLPPAVSENASIAAFSSARAMAHLRVIAAKPHPSNSEAHQKVMDYLQRTLTDLGLAPEIQKLPYNEAGGNVLATLKGTDSKHSILFSAHYDSVETSPGAGDNGSAVSAMLETIRALKNGPACKNDLIFLFTDQEEIGLYGAKAFTEHPLASQIAIIFNWDGRGNAGPIQMFETSGNNDWLISQFAQATPQAMGTSLANDIYKRMPNTTDFTVYKESLSSVQGLNFAHIENPRTYHDMSDSAEGLDERVLQQQGLIMTDLAHHFGNLSDFQQSAQDRIFFPLPLLGLVTYASFWTYVLLTLVLVLFGVSLQRTWKQGGLSIKGLVGTLVLYPIFMVIVSMIAKNTWRIIRDTNPIFKNPITGHPPYGIYFFLGVLVLTTVLMYILYRFLSSKLNPENLRYGVLFLLVFVTIAVSLILQGASYLFLIPMIFTLAASLINTTDPLKGGLLKSLLSVPAVLMFSQTLYFVYLGLAMSASNLISMLASIMLGFLVVLIPAKANHPT